jgi:hypothetical protein
MTVPGEVFCARLRPHRRADKVTESLDDTIPTDVSVDIPAAARGKSVGISFRVGTPMHCVCQ